MPKMFDSVKMGKITVSNRFVRSATSENRTNDKGLVVVLKVHFRANSSEKFSSSPVAVVMVFAARTTLSL